MDPTERPALRGEDVRGGAQKVNLTRAATKQVATVTPIRMAARRNEGGYWFWRVISIVSSEFWCVATGKTYLSSLGQGFTGGWARSQHGGWGR